MKLEQLPIELLERILSPHFSWAAIELWKCGNGILNSKLARGAVKYMDLRDFSGDSTGRWPRCIKHFKLESLSISRPIGLCTDYMLLQQVRKLSKNLKHLSITAESAPKALFSRIALSIDGNDYRSDDSGDEDFEDLSLDDVWKIAEKFPKLETLEVCGGSDDTSIVANFFHLLPRSLTHLKIANVLLKVKDPKVFAKLPPGLKHLELPLDTIDMDAMEHLPPSLTQIASSLSYSAHLALYEAPMFLPNLIAFPTRGGERVPKEMVEVLLEDQSLLDWPASMHYMLIVGIQSSLLKLPPNLTSLNFSATYGMDIDAERLRMVFPRTLTTIQGASINWTDIEILDWPPQLTSLMSYRGDYFGAHVFSKLPRSLKILMVTGGSLNWLSSTVKDPIWLRRQGLDVLTSIDSQRWQIAKEKLQKDVIPENVARVSAYIEAVEAGGLYGLPLGLSELKISGVTSDDPIELLWPPEIEFANLGDSLIPLTDTYFDLLPPSITFMNLLDTSTLDKLPSFLQELDIFIPNLKFTTRNFKCLPSSLIELRLTCASITAKEGWVHLLPRSLIKLNVVGGAIPGAELAKFPPKLERLECSTTDVTLLQVRKLPRTLRFIQIATIDKNPPKDRMNSTAWRALSGTYVPFFRFWEASKKEVKVVTSTQQRSYYWSRNFSSLAIKDIHHTVKQRYAQNDD